jgi:multiple antibiotic resistance protein
MIPQLPIPLSEISSQIHTFVGAIPVSFTALMPCVNPIGTAIILLSLTRAADSKTRQQLARRIALNTALLLIGSLFAGSYLLQFFGVSLPIVEAVGGLVLATMGWRMLNQRDQVDADKTATQTEPAGLWQSAFYPFTFPITIGPGCIAVAITLSAHSHRDTVLGTGLTQAGFVVGILAVSVLVYLCFQYSEGITKRLGVSGTSVLMRLISFLVACIGAQIAWDGISALLAQLSSSSR